MFRALKKRQAGVTLFEVLLVLFVAAFIAAAVATIYAKVTLTFKQNQLQSGLQQLTANVSAAYSGSGTGNYTGLSVESAVNAGLVPNDMHSDTTPVTPFSSDEGWGFENQGPGSYQVWVDNIPTAACSSMFHSLMQISTAAPLTIDEAAVTDAASGLAACSAGPDTHRFVLTVR